MDFNDSELSQPKGLNFIVLSSQEESQVNEQGERRLLTNLPGLKMETAKPSGVDTTAAQKSPAKKGKSLGAEVLRSSLGREGNSSDDDDENEGGDEVHQAALERVTDTGSEAELHIIPCSQKPFSTVPETETQSDTDGGMQNYTSFKPRHQALDRSSSSDDADKTLKAASASDNNTGDETIKVVSSGLSSERYKVGSGLECELSHTQSPNLKKKTLTENKESEEIQQLHSPKDIFTVPDSEEERHIVLTPSEHIGSLQLSQSVALVPESQEEQSLGDVPPSLDAYGAYPIIIPSSPTDHSSDRDPSLEEVSVYKPEELSTLASNGEQSKSNKDNNSRSGSSSRSEKQSSGSCDKSNGDHRESIKAWQPMTMLSPDESVSDEGTVKSVSRKLHLSRSTVDPEHSEVITAGVSRFIPSLSEQSTEDTDSLKLKLSASHTEDDPSHDDSPELEQVEGTVSEYLDSQHVALHLSPSQPDTTGFDSESSHRKDSKKQKSSSQSEIKGTKRTKIKAISSSDPTPDASRKNIGKVITLFEPRPPGGADDDNDLQDKPLSSTPESTVDDFLLGENPVSLKPSLSLSMIDVQDEEDSSVYSFKLTRPTIHLPKEPVVPQGESLFKKGLSPQKRRKRHIPNDSTEEDSLKILPSSGKRSLRDKQTPQTSTDPGLSTPILPSSGRRALRDKQTPQTTTEPGLSTPILPSSGRRALRDKQTPQTSTEPGLSTPILPSSGKRALGDKQTPQTTTEAGLSTPILPSSGKRALGDEQTRQTTTEAGLSTPILPSSGKRVLRDKPTPQTTTELGLSTPILPSSGRRALRDKQTPQTSTEPGLITPILPSSGKRALRDKRTQQTSAEPGLWSLKLQQLSQRSQTRKSDKPKEIEIVESKTAGIVTEQKEIEDPDLTIPLEDTSYGKAGVCIDKPKTERSQKDSQKSVGGEDTLLYAVESYTGLKDKESEETSVTMAAHQESEETINPNSSTSMAPVSTKTPVTPTSQSRDPYDFIESQSQNVSAAIKDPNTTPVTMPKGRGKTSTVKKRRKKTLTKVRVTRVRPGTKASEGIQKSSSSEYDKRAGRENVGFGTPPSIIRRSASEGQTPIKKTVRLSVGPPQTEPVQSTSVEVTSQTQPVEVTSNPAQIPLNLSDSNALSGSQSTVRHRIIVTTKKRILYEHRKITIEEWKDGKIIYSQTREENEKPVVEKESVTTHREKEMLSPGVSPSRSTSTVTSGDLGDISSSLSRSSSHGSKTSSGGSTFDRMHSSLDRTPSLGTLSSRDDSSLPVRMQSINSISSQKSSSLIGEDLAKNQPVTSTLTEESLAAKEPAMHCGSDVLFTSSDPEKFDHSKHVSRELDGSRMELSPIVVEQQYPHVAVTQKQAADSSDDNRISGGKTQTVIVSPEISSSLGERQTSGGFVVTDPVIGDQEKSESDSTSRTTRMRAGNTPRTSRKAKSTAQKSTSSDEIPVVKKRKVATPKPGTSAGPVTSKKSQTLLDISASSDDISPEIPNQAAEISDPVVDKADYIRVTPDNVSSYKGYLVIAKWRDGYYYPGELIGCKSNEKCTIQFADGDKMLVRLTDVIITERLSIGQSVLVESSDGGFDPGLVIGYNGRGKTVGYTIERDDAMTKNYMRDKVILSADQAGLILGENQDPSTPAPAQNIRLADVSLENLVEGKRRTRRDPVSELKSAAKGSSSKATSTKGKKRKLPAFEPTTTSTPTPKQGKRTTRLEAVTPQKIEKLGGIVESPLTVKRSARKVRTGLFDSAKGPMPTDPHLFEGMVFLLTHVDKTLEQKMAEKKLLEGSSFETSTDESAVDEEVSVPFDKEHLKAQIQAGGGSVLSRFDITKVSGGSNCYLISDSYQRTVKYFQCLAAGIMCVSHVWVRDSSKQCILLDPGSYVLPAGVNIETNRLVECSRRNPLVGLAVSVVSLSEEYRDAWLSILETAGCVVTSQLSTEVTVDPDLGAVVADCTCPKNFITKSEKVNVPVVSTEWVIQCLIRGEFLETKSSPRFHPHFAES